MRISNGVTYSTSNGGVLRILSDTTSLESTGVAGGWAFFDNVYIDPYNPMIIDVESRTKVSLETEEGEGVLSFSITSSVPNGEADFKFNDLEGESWYRLTIDGVLASTISGRAHGKTTETGKVKFNGVTIGN